MVDKIKPIKKTPNNSIDKPKENKRERFLRIAKKRTEKVLKAMSLLGNCSNKSNYEYTDIEARKMIIAVGNAYELLKSKYSESKKGTESFEF